MNFLDYLTPSWIISLKSLGVVLAGGGIVCLGVILGLKSGFDSVFGKEEKSNKKDKQ